ncbi:hypothetical protein [Bythopirellula goksoeyrii]|uniref:BON domain protein n=1 Tax=Bythopirellula goksoeyrii TaxID=1400387 RepID=A0A5B9QGS0_9BACT|nr:hypothetical protein [Bythopirellula goksoeyrii]QEG37119.1 hypothetical protein Pr1d_44590 [Bythopirellula goksoeyrii]
MGTIFQQSPTSEENQTSREYEASFVSGVATMENPQGQLRTGLVGEEVAHLVREQLESQLPGRIRQLKVSSAENSIVLTGACSSYYTKQLAQHVAMEVLSCERLVNELAVLKAK